MAGIDEIHHGFVDGYGSVDMLVDDPNLYITLEDLVGSIHDENGVVVGLAAELHQGLISAAMSSHFNVVADHADVVHGNELIPVMEIQDPVYADNARLVPIAKVHGAGACNIPHHYTTLNHTRDLVQFREVLKAFLKELGDDRVTSIIGNIHSPVPTTIQLCKEEQHEI